MTYCHVRIEKGLPYSVQAAGEVDVLAVKEKTLVEQTGLLQSTCPAHKETTGQCRDVHDMIVPRVLQFVAGITLADEHFGQETPA